MRALLACLVALLLAGCGFQLRGSAPLPFSTIYVPASGGIGLQLKRNIEADTRARVVADPKQAQARLEVTRESRTMRIQSLDANGRVSAYRLLYTVGFRVIDAKGGYYVPPTRLQLSRYMTYSDTHALAKLSEEGLLYREMQSNAVQRIILLLAGSKAPAAGATK